MSRRDSYKPGGGAGPSSSGTMMVKADGVKRVERKPTPLPDRKEPAAPPVVVGATGRGLPVATGPKPEELPPPIVDDGPRKPGGPSPFSGYAPTANELAKSATAGAESSNQVAAIVLGMGFVLSVISVLVLIILGVGLFAWTQVVETDAVADAGEGKGHVVDTAAGEIIEKVPGQAPRPKAPGDPESPDGPPPETSAPTTGPVTISVPEHVFFHSLEINCPDAGIRRRASFRGRKASTTGVPINEDCVVTFQGSQPAKTTVRGGQTKECISFNPTECRTL